MIFQEKESDVALKRFYMPQLDGIRFFAFFLVFVHHIDTGVFLFPKKAGYEFGGEMAPDQVAYREERVCLGIRYSMYEGPFVEQRCMDCSKTVYCIGVPLQKRCYELLEAEKEVVCR